MTPAVMRPGDFEGSARALIAAVAAQHGVRSSDLFDRVRRPDIDAARAAAIKAVQAAFPRASSTRIGRLFGRHHTSILHCLGRLGAGRRAPEFPADWLARCAEIVRDVALEHGVCAADVGGRSEFREHIAARIAAVRRIRQAMPQLPLRLLGRAFAGRRRETMSAILRKTLP